MLLKYENEITILCNGGSHNKKVDLKKSGKLRP